jgi:hypothetical protein
VVPFPTALLADALHSGTVGDLRVATILYSAAGALQSAAWLPMISYLHLHPELVDPDAEELYFRNQRTRPWIGASLDALTIVVAVVAPKVAVALCVFPSIYHAVTSDGIGSVRARGRRFASPAE